MKKAILLLVSAAAAFVLLPAVAQASSTSGFHAVFHDVAFQNSCVPPIVFCGTGEVNGFGLATTTVRVTSNIPIPGTGCTHATGLRWISLDDGSGTLAATFDGVRCPIGAGNAFRVDFSWTADPGSSTGVFAGATGGGDGFNITAGNVQVASMTGTLALP